MNDELKALVADWRDQAKRLRNEVVNLRDGSDKRFMAACDADQAADELEAKLASLAPDGVASMNDAAEHYRQGWQAGNATPAPEQANPCKCVDCNGTEPSHSHDCTYMRDYIVDEQDTPKAEDVASAHYKDGWLAGHTDASKDGALLREFLVHWGFMQPRILSTNGADCMDRMDAFERKVRTFIAAQQEAEHG